MAKVIIGGQTLCLLLTLLVTPVAYSLFDDLGRYRLARRLGQLSTRFFARWPSRSSAPPTVEIPAKSVDLSR